MLKFYGEMMKRLSTDEDGVVSFEYIIVAACIIGAVVAAFGTGTGGAFATALTWGGAALSSPFFSPPCVGPAGSPGGAGHLAWAPPFFWTATVVLGCSPTLVFG